MTKTSLILTKIHYYCMDALYPKTCPICKEILYKDERLVCNGCKPLLSAISEPRCFRCGKEISDEEEELCSDCKNHRRSFVMGFPALNYEGPIVDSIADFKYHNKKEYGEFFASQICDKENLRIKSVMPEVIIPVPIHDSKLKKRGYNQAEVLAKELSKLINIPVDAGVIVRNRYTLPQKNLGSEERENNLKKAFIYSGKKVKYKRALLVDDIYTTGATIEACTRVLNSIGIRDVYYTSICVGKGY